MGVLCSGNSERLKRLLIRIWCADGSYHTEIESSKAHAMSLTRQIVGERGLLGVEQMAVPCCTGGHWLLLLLTRRLGLPSTITTFNPLGTTQSRPCLLSWLTFLRAPIPTLSGWPLSWTEARALSQQQQASGSQDCLWSLPPLQHCGGRQPIDPVPPLALPS